MVPSQVPKDNADVNFVPQTEYWKKVIKIAKPLQSSKIGIDPLSKESKGVKNKPDFVRIHLFTEEIVQKEVLSILKRFLDSTEFMLNSGSNTEKEEKNPNLIEVVSFHTKLNLETQKYLQVTRLYGSLIAILLARTKKEQISGLQSLMVDLNVENVKFAEFLRLFFIENDGLNILFWIMKTHVEDFDILQVTVDILSCLNIDGAHYQQFIEVLGKEENIKVR